MDRWDDFYLGLASYTSSQSKDPSTQVGAVLVGKDKEVLSLGYNGFPRGIKDSYDRLINKELKYELVVHAEINAVLNAARNGINTNGATLYTIAKDITTGKSWSGVCIRCAVELINAGIKKVVVVKSSDMPESWKESCLKSAKILQEAGIEYQELQ